MTKENQAKLLQAYKFATEANQDGIADLLRDVILGEMEGVGGNLVYRNGGISVTDRGVIRPLDGTYVTWTGNDPMSKEMTA